MIGIHAVPDGAPNERHPMENQRGFFWVFEQQLLQDIEYDSEGKKRKNAATDDEGCGVLCE